MPRLPPFVLHFSAITEHRKHERARETAHRPEARNFLSSVDPGPRPPRVCVAPQEVSSCCDFICGPAYMRSPRKRKAPYPCLRLSRALRETLLKTVPDLSFIHSIHPTNTNEGTRPACCLIKSHHFYTLYADAPASHYLFWPLLMVGWRLLWTPGPQT